MRKLLLGALCLALLPLSTSCYFEIYCARLDWKIRKPETRSALREWVSRNVEGVRISADEVRGGDGFVPGRRWLGKTFDSRLLGLSDAAHVRLVGPEAQDEIDDTITESLKAVLFTDHSRTGILVRPTSSSEFGAEAKDLRVVEPDIAIYCAVD